jgi:uncharacterized protein
VNRKQQRFVIAEIRIVDGKPLVACLAWHLIRAAEYVCGKNVKPFTAAFYDDTDPKSAVLTYGDDQVVALIQQTGSGTRYSASSSKWAALFPRQPYR